MPATSSSSSAAPHLLIPFAASSDPAWLPTVKAMPAEKLRHARQLLQGMTLVHTDQGDAESLSPPHERALARALGIASADTPDGLIPWAARDAAQHLPAPAGKAWAWITPCHWSMGREHATLTDPSLLKLREDESQALLAAMQPYFDADGITLHYVPALGPAIWLAEGELFRTLPSASLDRVLGRNVDRWLPDQNMADKTSPARKLRLLQNEMQMLLYTHALNDERAARKQLPVNSFWLSGTGALPGEKLPSAKNPLVPRNLAQAVFNEDWQAYAAAWSSIDAGEIAQLLLQQRAGGTVRLTLCGEKNAMTFETRQGGFFAKIRSSLSPVPLLKILEQI